MIEDFIKNKIETLNYKKSNKYNKSTNYNIDSNETLIDQSIYTKLESHLVHLTEVAIHPNYLHQGFGTYILSILIKSFPNGTRFGLEVSTTSKNAIKLYQKCGFKIVRQIKDYYHKDAHCYKMTLWAHFSNDRNDKNIKTNNIQKEVTVAKVNGNGDFKSSDTESGLDSSLKNLSLK